MKKLSKNQEQLGILLGWLDGAPKFVRLVHASYCREFCLENDETNFCYNFYITDTKRIKGLNKLLCLWANKGWKSKTDYNDKDILDFDDYFTGLAEA